MTTPSHRALLLYVPVVSMGCGLFLALLGLFSGVGVVVVGLTSLFAVALIGRSHAFKRPTLVDGAILALIIFSSLFIGWFHHAMPVFRDEMSFLYAARELTQNGGIVWENFFSHSSHGVRHLSGDKFTSQFLPGYLVPLSTADALAGLNGMLWVNAVFFLLSLLTFFAIFRLFPHGRKRFLLFAGLFSLALPIVWFSRRTNNELLYLFLFWLSAYSLTRGWTTRTLLYPLLGILPAFYLAFVRPEGLMYALLYACIVVVFTLVFRKTRRGTPLMTIFGSGVVLALFYAMLLRQTGAEYISGHTIGFLDPLFSQPGVVVLLGLVVLLLLAVVVWQRKRIRSYFTPQLAVRVIYGLYVAIGVLLLAAISWLLLARTGILVIHPIFKFVYAAAALSVVLIVPAFLMAIRLMKGRTKELLLLLPILVFSLPSLAFLFEAYIALDLPWYFRRFLPTFIPLVLFLFSFFLVARTKPYFDKSRGVLFAAFLLATIGVSAPILTFRASEGVEPQLQAFAETIDPDRDILLMENGWRWQRWSQQLQYFYDAPVIVDEQNISDGRLRDELLSRERILYLYSHTSRPRVLTSHFCTELLDPLAISYEDIDSTDSLVGHLKANDLASLAIPQSLLLTTWPIATAESDESEETANVCELTYIPRTKKLQ